MTSINPLFGICTKLGEITNQIVGTKHEIVPGELLKMYEVNRSDNTDRYVIKLYDHSNKRFGRELYQCDKAIINQLNNNIFSFASGLTEGANITVNLEIPEGKINVNFSIKSIGINVPQLGAGRFFALDLIDTPNLAEENKLNLRLKYFVPQESAYCMRCDRLIERLIIDQRSTMQPVITSKLNHISNFNQNKPPLPLKSKIITTEVPLICFDDTKPLLKTFVVPPVILNPNDSQLQNLRNGLNDLRELTELEPNGMNEYGFSNIGHRNIIDHHLQKRNGRIQENILVETITNSRHSTPASNNYYTEAASITQIRDFRAESIASSNNVPTSILRKVVIPIKDSSSQGGLIRYELPKVQPDEETHIDTTQQINRNIPFEDTTQTNNTKQNQNSSILKNVNMKSKPRKNRRKNPQIQNKSTTCYICHKVNGNAVQLSCQHLFCPPCLVNRLKNLEDAHCPFQNGKYVCNYKLDFQDIEYILKSLNKSLPVPSNNNTQILPRGFQEPRPTINEEFFVCDDGDSNEVFFNCKQANCNGGWFVDKTEGRNTYPCPICETYNCFRCRAIHENMTCEEYNQHNPTYLNKNPILENRRTAEDYEYQQDLGEITWRCEYCTFNENLMDTAICKVCAKTNHNIVKTRKSTETEYYRLLELEENDNFVPNFYEFECIICAEMIKPDGGIQLRGCLHNFCRNCISRYIEGQDQPEIICPFDECTNLLEDREIKSLVTPDVYARHLEISLRVGKTQIKNGYQCCVANCQGWWIFTDGIYEYNCPACRTINCISCKASHSGIDCKTYQQNLFYSTDKNGVETRQRLEQMLKTGEAEHCPKCNIIVVKNGGCAHMKCSMCRFDFQWGVKRNTNLNIK